MRILLVLIGVAAGHLVSFAQSGPASESPLSPKEDAIEQLLSERESQDALDAAVLAARKLEVSEQAILEARFLFHVDRAEDARIAVLLPQFLAQKDKFKLEESEIFASEDDWLAVVEYVQAIAAMQTGDKAAFKRHITEAFWLSPRQGAAFAPHIDRMRLMDAMKAIRVDMSKGYPSILSDDQVLLGAGKENQKGVLLHFWSPWSRECEASLPDFFITAGHLAQKNIGVVSVLPETSDKVMEDAKQLLASTGKRVPGSWVVDTKKSALSTLLKVQSVPTVVLVSPLGNVLYNGHPANDEFWEALKQLDPAVDRPEASVNGR